MKLASIEKITSLRPHSNADRLEIANVLGWQTIVKKGEFKEGDTIVFVVIDTILPDTEWSNFLKDGDKPIRLRSIKLRGEYSQGLVLPLSVLPEHMQGWQEGADVGGELDIKKYEKEIPSRLSGEVAGSFPSYLAPQTDEDNGLSNPDLVKAVLQDSVWITQKLDGSSMTVIFQEGEITHVCSRRISLKETDTNSFWISAKKLVVPFGWSGVIQGELMGPGIQGNQLELKEATLFVYQVKELRGGWMDLQDIIVFSEAIKAKTVPYVSWGAGLTLQELQKIADGQNLPNGNPAEGIVVRPIGQPTSGTGRPLGFKIINRNYVD